MSDTNAPQSFDLMIGQEFLTWLWFRSETDNVFKAGDDTFHVFMEQRIVVQGGEGDLIETASVSGAMSELREARLGLTTGKKVTRALLRMEQDPETWQVSIKAEDFGMSGFKTPKIEADAEKDDDADGAFFEKMFLLEKGLGFFDAIFRDFIRLRLSKDWKEQVQYIQGWMYPAED